jgi:CBS domain-containing protein
MIVRNVLSAKKSRKVILVAPDATVREALAHFVEHNIGSLPVVSASGELVGIFTERDVLFKAHEDPDGFPRRRISEVMTPDPVTCGPEDVVHDVMGLMSKYQVGQLPVVEGGKLIAVVSVGDLIKALFERVEAENRHLLTYIYGPA